ncbi:MAG: hypothetical protein ACK47T_12540, partial [Brevundimonas sp.]
GAAARGAPARPARDRRAAGGVTRWETEKNPSAAADAVFAVLGLGAIDILILLPILMTVLGIMFGVFFAVVGTFIADERSDREHGAAGTLLAITAIWLVNGLVWFARLHYRLLKPAIEPQAQGRA